jgi:hypothetical protein
VALDARKGNASNAGGSIHPSVIGKICSRTEYLNEHRLYMAKELSGFRTVRHQEIAPIRAVRKTDTEACGGSAEADPNPDSG